ncbi:cytochrome p450, partial [Rhizoctonia solani]
MPRSISATLLRSIYGYEAAASDDCYLVETQAIFSFMTKSLLTSSYLVNIIPVLKYVPEWFPGAGWKRDAIKWRKRKDTLIKDMYKIGLKNMSTDESSQIIFGSLRKQALSIGLTDKEAEDHVDQIAITMFAGGTDTNVNTLLMFFMAMVLYPSVQKKAHDEIDLVLGHSRLPKVEDQAQLNYIDRIVQETLRWAPVTPIAFPHTCFRDDVYKGYRIPKGAIVAMTRDETVYKNAEAFDPDRFLNSTTPPSPLFGRCPGVHFAQSSLFITIASILMAFDIRAVKDGNGQDILPSGKMTSSAVLTPEHFEFELMPRSEKHKELTRNGL